MITVKLNIDVNTDDIYSKLRLDEAQKLLTKEVAQKCDDYTPKLTGNLISSKKVEDKSISYAATNRSITSYAAKQYYTNKGNGIRGKQWEKRMWSDRGQGIVRTVADFIAGGLG